MPKVLIDAGPRDTQCHLIFDCVPAPSVFFSAEQRAHFFLTTGDELPESDRQLSADDKIAQLEDALRLAETNNSRDNKTLELEKELKVARESLEELKKNLSQRISHSIIALKKSQTSADNQIQRNRWVSILLESFCALALICGVIWWWHQQSTISL